MSDDAYLNQKRHFEDPLEGQPIEEHLFEQLNMDLEWGLRASLTFKDRDGQPPANALILGVKAIAGRRYHRFREAEEDEKEQRAQEQRELANFWYRLKHNLEQLFDVAE